MSLCTWKSASSAPHTMWYLNKWRSHFATMSKKNFFLIETQFYEHTYIHIMRNFSKSCCIKTFFNPLLRKALHVMLRWKVPRRMIKKFVKVNKCDQQYIFAILERIIAIKWGATMIGIINDNHKTDSITIHTDCHSRRNYVFLTLNKK